MNLGETGSGSIDWIGLAQDMDQWRALVNAAISLPVPYNAGKSLRACKIGGLSSSAQLHRIS
jgi:hypothetical protein